MDLLRGIFDSSGFTPRWSCGLWSPLLGWTHIVADLLIFAAYFAIPLSLVLIVRKRRDAPYPGLLALFATFILCCGTTHLIEAIIFYEPVYRLSAIVKVATAIVSLLTAFVLIRALPAMLSAPASLRERAVLQESLELERQRAASLAEEREPFAKRSAELTSRTRRISAAFAAGRVVALRWRVDDGAVIWEIGMAEAARQCGVPQMSSFDNWRALVSDECAVRLREAVVDVDGTRPLEFEADLKAHAGFRLRLTAALDPLVTGEPRTATGMFRLIHRA